MNELAVSIDEVKNRVYFIRGVRVMLDRDLAQFYGVETRILKRSVKSNSVRFPADFMFELTKAEHELLRSNIGTSKASENLETCTVSEESSTILRSNFRISKTETRGGDRYLPLAFSELGVAMLSSVLNTDKAVQVNIALMRTFTQLRHSFENQNEIVQKMDSLSSKFEALSNHFKLSLAKQAEINFGLSEGIVAQRKLPPPSLVKLPMEERIQEILTAVAGSFGIQIHDLVKSRRIKPVVLARQIAIFLIRERAQIGFKTIGAYLGGRDHTTILHAYKRIRGVLKADKNICKVVLDIENILDGNGL